MTLLAVPRRTAVATAAAGLALAFVLGACTGAGEPSASPGVAVPGITPAPTGTGSGAAGADPLDGEVTATVTTLAEGLDVPWGLAPLPDGRLLVTLRDAARLVVVDPATGDVAEVTGPGAEDVADQTRPAGEGGLLGVVVVPDDDGGLTAVVHRTGEDDNAVLAGPLDVTADGATLGPVTTLLDGIPRGTNHDGGRLAVGPDGFLYVTTGDAGDPSRAPDLGSLGGKVLRVTLDGDPAPGNPDPGSPVWTSGHRNVQGIGWDAAGRAFASELGQNRLDELNVLEPGQDHGWPAVEGPGDDDRYADPVAWWPTSEASPSGLAVTDEAVYLAGLRGETLWRVPLLGTAADVAAGTSPGLGTPQPLLRGEHGRLRAVLAQDDGSLLVLTGNTDGRGSPRDGDDRLLRVEVSAG